MADPKPSRGLSAIILAAGANTRLDGRVPPFMKPLVLVNGKPLVNHARDHAVHNWGCDSLIFVASPSNVGLLLNVARLHSAHWIVQPTPMGVVDAITRAMPFVVTGKVLILCADNTFENGSQSVDFFSFARRSVHSWMGVRTLDALASKRFTRYRHRKVMVDTTVHSDPEPKIIDTLLGVELIEAGSPELGDGCWIGPLLLQTLEIRTALQGRHPPQTIVELIKATTNDGRELRVAPMLCADMGVPEELA